MSLGFDFTKRRELTLQGTAEELHRFQGDELGLLAEVGPEILGRNDDAGRLNDFFLKSDR